MGPAPRDRQLARIAFFTRCHPHPSADSEPNAPADPNAFSHADPNAFSHADPNAKP